MATARAIANGNWSSASTWNGGVIPGNGDTVYSNGFVIQLDTDILIGGGSNPIVSAGSFVSGQWYEVDFVGTTTWTSIGAASNTAGTVFLATGVGSGTGTAKAIATLTTTNNTAAGAAAGGSFVMSTVRAMTCDLRAGTTTCLNVTATTGTLVLANIRAIAGTSAGAHAINTTANMELQSGCLITGNANSTAHAINTASASSITVSGSSTFAGGGTSGIALNHASTGSVTVSSSCTFTGGGAGSSAAYALNNASTGSITISSACVFTGAAGSFATNAFALNNASTGSVTISGACTFTGGGNASAYALFNSSTGSVTVTSSTFTASAFTNAVNIANSGADVRLSGDFLDHWSGWKAVSGGKWRLGTAPTLGQTRYALAGTTDSYFTEFGSDYGSFGNPIAANVRSGVVYGGGNLTGTCAVPAAGSVAFGVPVDNTTGTAILTQANVQAALTAQGLTSARAGNLDNLDAAVSSRLAPSGTLATVTNLTNAPASVTPADIWGYNSRTLTSASGPTAVEIRQEMDSNSTKLANLDATVSSRLAAASYTAPSAAPSAASVATAVRSELSTELARVDVAVSSRLAASESTKLDAVKAQTDQLPIQRLQNVATTNIVGTLIAQANS